MKIGWIQSFEDPEKWFLITRNGKVIRDGGDGIVWICNCPYGRRTQPCEHLMFLSENFIDIPSYNNFKLLKDGKEYYRKFLKAELDRINNLLSFVY